MDSFLVCVNAYMCGACVCMHTCCSLCLKTLSMLTWFISSFNWVSSFLFNWISSSNWVSCRKKSAKFYNMKELKSHVYTPVYKLDDLWEPTVGSRELYSGMYGDLDGGRSRREGIYIHMVDSLCSEEISTPL